MSRHVPALLLVACLVCASGASAHVLRVRHPLYETWERPVTIRPGQTEKIVIDLPAEGVRKQP